MGYTKQVKKKAAASQIDAKPASGHLRRLVALLTISITVGVLAYAAIQFIPLFIVDNFGISEEAAAAIHHTKIIQPYGLNLPVQPLFP